MKAFMILVFLLLISKIAAYDEKRSLTWSSYKTDACPSGDLSFEHVAMAIGRFKNVSVVVTADSPLCKWYPTFPTTSGAGFLFWGILSNYTIVRNYGMPAGLSYAVSFFVASASDTVILSTSMPGLTYNASYTIQLWVATIPFLPTPTGNLSVGFGVGNADNKVPVVYRSKPSSWSIAGWTLLTTPSTLLQSVDHTTPSVIVEGTAIATLTISIQGTDSIRRGIALSGVTLTKPSSMCAIAHCYYCSQCADCCRCAAGSYCPGDDYQYGCPVGTYSGVIDATSSEVCLQCGRGTYAPSGSATCLTCPAGTYAALLDTASTSTPTGYLGAAGLWGCPPCPANTFNPTPGGMANTTCSACPLGQTSLAGSSVCSYASIVVAGGGWSYGDGYTATSVALSSPNAVAVDKFSNIFVIEGNNCRVRKVAAVTSVITTVVGQGPCGSSYPDGQTGTATWLNYYPSDLAVDYAGNVYIADTYSHRIRKWNAVTSLVTTVAGTGVATMSGDGGSATAAGVYYPSAVTLDISANIYIGDPIRPGVRFVSVLTGVIKTLVGGGTVSLFSSAKMVPATSAMLSVVSAMCVDVLGNLYVTSQTVVYKMRVNDSQIAVLPSTVPLYNAWGCVVSPSGRDVYVADAGNGLQGHNVVRLSARGGPSVVVMGTGAAATMDNAGAGLAVAIGLYTPKDVSMDVYGNIFVADSQHQKIRKIILSEGTCALYLVAAATA